MKAYVLIKISPGEILPALKLLRRLDGIEDATMTFGPYDAVAVVEGCNIKQISHQVSCDIQSIPGVLETCTCLAVDQS